MTEESTVDTETADTSDAMPDFDAELDAVAMEGITFADESDEDVPFLSIGDINEALAPYKDMNVPIRGKKVRCRIIVPDPLDQYLLLDQDDIIAAKDQAREYIDTEFSDLSDEEKEQRIREKLDEQLLSQDGMHQRNKNKNYQDRVLLNFFLNEFDDPMFVRTADEVDTSLPPKRQPIPLTQVARDVRFELIEAFDMVLTGGGASLEFFRRFQAKVGDGAGEKLDNQ